MYAITCSLGMSVPTSIARSSGSPTTRYANCAAAQFAYLVVGEPLDRAMLVGTLMPREQVIAYTREGVLTFLARYQRARPRNRRRP